MSKKKALNKKKGSPNLGEFGALSNCLMKGPKFVAVLKGITN